MITYLAIAGLALGSMPLVRAADDSMVGKWKFNQEKSQLTGLTYTVEGAGNNQYTFVFGDDKETVALDGKPHVTKFGETWMVTKSGPSAWHWITQRDGKVTNDATWTVSADGATSSYVNKAMRPDGSVSNDSTELKRTAGTGDTLVGTWEGTATKVGSPIVIEMAAWGKDGYSLKMAALKQETDFKLDGKEYTPKGPTVPKGQTVMAKKGDDGSIELTYKLHGKVTETDSWSLSKDGKMLTDTINYSGMNKPEVDAYERE